MPDAASSATRCSDGVSCPLRRGPTLARASSARARSAHSGTCNRSKMSSASCRLADADSFLRCRRCNWPSSNSVRARSNGIGSRSCSAIARRGGRAGGVEVTPGGQQHASATGADGQHPRAVQPLAVALEGVDEGLRLGAAAHLNQGLDGVHQKRGIGKLGRCRRRIELGHQRLQRRDRGLVVAQRHFQESECANDPLASTEMPRCACRSRALPRRPPWRRLRGRRTRQLRPQAVRQEQRGVAAELAGPLHGVLGDQAGLDEVAPPDAAQHHVLGDEDELAFLTLLPAAAPDASSTSWASSRRPVHSSSRAR